MRTHKRAAIRSQTLALETLERRACPAAVSIAAPIAISEAGIVKTITVSLDAPSAATVSVGYFVQGTATLGADYDLTQGGRRIGSSTGTLTFAPGQTRQTIALSAINDTLREGNETLSITLIRPRGCTLGVNKTSSTILRDDDNYTAVIVGAASISAGGDGRYTLQLSASATKSETFYVSTVAGSATAGSDFVPLQNMPLAFRAGERSKEFRVQTKANTPGEYDEQFYVQAIPSTKDFGDVQRYSVTIPGQGAAPPPPPPPLPNYLSISDVSLTEGNSGQRQATFNVSLSRASTSAVSVTYSTADGTATAADTDYLETAGSLTFAPGELTKLVSVPVVGDTVAESDEYFALVLSGAVNAEINRPRGFCTIRNDDVATAVDAWTIFVYMTGDDLNRFAFEDINEMEQSLNKLPSTVNIVVSWDQTSIASIPAYSTGNGSQQAWRSYGRSVLKPDNSRQTIGSEFEIFPGDKNTGDPKTLVEFVQWGTQQAPALNYALMMWGHGGGLIGSNEDKESGGDEMLGPELARALATTGMPAFKIVGFDSCLMGMVEVGHAVAPSMAADSFFVASQESEDGAGHDYTTVFDSLVGNPYAATAEVFARGIVQSYQNAPHNFLRDTYSASRASAFPELASAIRTFAASASNGITFSQWYSLRIAANLAPTYGEKTFRDLGSFMANVASANDLPQALRTAATTVISTLRSTVIARTSDVRNSSGLSIYLRADGFYDARYAADAPSFIAVTGWDRFVLWLSTGVASQSTASTVASSRQARFAK
jgi:hypothetical protein